MGNLLHSLDKLLALHGINLRNPREVFGGKCRNTLISKGRFCSGDGIANGENARVKQADDIARIGFIHNFTLGSHHLRRLRQLDFLAALHMQHVHAALKFTGANTCKRNAVAVGFIHVRLNFENKGGEVRAGRLNESGAGVSRKRRGRQAQKLV